MKRRTTILYLGGEGTHAEDFLTKDTKEFQNIGVLISYYSLKRQQKQKRLLGLKEKNKPKTKERKGK